MSGRRRTLPASGLAALLGVTLTVLVGACSLSGLAFVEDERIDIVQPESRQSVELPFTVAWTEGDLSAGTRFAVLIDRAPPRPGSTVDSLFSDDAGCRGRPGCPDAAYLADRGVYEVDGTSVTIEHLPRGSSGRQREIHEATVILLDSEGRRVGEGAWWVQFDVMRP